MKDLQMIMPPLQALLALEALDRLGSIKAVAEDLNLSQSAVSHKLKTLETALQFGLTVPNGRSVLLTSQARQYVRSVRPALEALKVAHETVSTASGALSVACVPGFAAFWLAPRLAQFGHLFPDIEIGLQTDRTGDNQDADVRIVFADTGEVPLDATLLMRVRFFPVCSPAFAHKHPLPDKPADVSQEQMLHLSRRSDWADWIETASGAEASCSGGIVFDDVQTMLAAAQAGQGICLGDRLTCDAALREGSLIRPYRGELETNNAYHIVTRKGGASPSATAFREWVTGQLLD